MKLNLSILAIGLTVTSGVFGIPVTLDRNDEALSSLTKRYFYITCDPVWASYCQGQEADTHCDAYSGLIFGNSEECKVKCRCDYSGIYPCHHCYVAEGTADTAEDTEASVIDGKAEATGV